MDDKLMKHGAFSWFELVTGDVEGSREFYGKLFGWTTESMEMGGQVLMGPQDIPEVGRFCVLQDPNGALISAITYKTG